MSVSVRTIPEGVIRVIGGPDDGKEYQYHGQHVISFCEHKPISLHPIDNPTGPTEASYKVRQVPVKRRGNGYVAIWEEGKQ